MTDPNQAPAVEDRGILEHLEGLGRAFLSTRPGQLATVAVASLSMVGAAEAYSAEPVLATANPEPAKVLHHGSDLSPQTILDKIHAVIPSHDSTEHLGVPVDPISGYLEPSMGTFRANCKSKYSATFKYFKITPEGVGFQSCGTWLGTPLDLPTKSTPNQFQGPLNHLGKLVQSSVGLTDGQATVRIDGNRKKVTAEYQCPETSSVAQGDSEDTQVTGVSEIALKEASHSKSAADITMC